jgi:PTS system galactitol-specific IIA component
LPTHPYGIAIPHTDVEHVLRGAIAIGLLEEPVQFREMGGSSADRVNVRMICVLAIADPARVATVLRALALSFQNPDFLERVSVARSPDAVTALFHEQMPGIVSTGSGEA